MDFKELGIKQEIVKALSEEDIIEPTDIQVQVIPKIKSGNDIIAISKTGSGKTIAFGSSILDNIKSGQGIQVLIVVPVRELAEQVAREIRKLTKYMKFSTAVVYGGVSLQPQIFQIKKADIVVGTPGRLVDHLSRRSLDLSKIKVVVLDEADKMSTMGFIEDIEILLKATPKQRQTLLFGATISDDVSKLKNHYMQSPIVIKSQAHVEENYLNQFYYDVDIKEKFSMLVHLIKKENPKLAIVFCSTRRNADLTARNLIKNDIDAQVIHGGMSQGKRLNVINGFHKGKPHVLVATAVAARGLDIKNITHIFNYNVPKNPEEYVHQIGRTARAGKSGKAITLLSSNEHSFFSAVLQKYPVKILKLPREEFKRAYFDVGRRQFDSRTFNRPRRQNHIHRYN